MPTTIDVYLTELEDTPIYNHLVNELGDPFKGLRVAPPKRRTIRRARKRAQEILDGVENAG